MKFDIPIIATVEAKTIEEARQIVYSIIDDRIILPDASLQDKVIFDMADDSYCNAGNQRLVLLHPEDVSNDYDVDLYNANLKKERE